MKDKVIIFFTRIPTIGKTKTRLEPFLDKNLCVELQTAFIKDIYKKISNMKIDVIISYSDHGDLEVLKNLLGEELYFLRQYGDDLGEKMNNAISFALNKYKSVVLIGSDIPLIEAKDIEIAFKILETKDTVISPTFDGGYYLIGMNEENKNIFDIEYSTSTVFETTLLKIKNLDKSFGIGNIQLDIDDKYDFLKLYDILKLNNKENLKNTRDLVNKIMEKCDKFED